MSKVITDKAWKLKEKKFKAQYPNVPVCDWDNILEESADCITEELFNVEFEKHGMETGLSDVIINETHNIADALISERY